MKKKCQFPPDQRNGKSVRLVITEWHAFYITSAIGHIAKLYQCCQAVRWQRRYDYRRAKRNGTGVLSKTFGKGRPIRQADLMRRV